MTRPGKTDRLPVVTRSRPAADIMTDVVVVGSDPGALSAALALRQGGWEVILIEPGKRLGGRAVHGSGRLWLPGRPQVMISGVADDYGAARNYFDQVVGTETPATRASRRHAFFRGTPKLYDWLTALGVKLRPDEAGDHYPSLPDGARGGRVYRPKPVGVGEIGRMAEFIADQVGPANLVDRRQVASGGAALVVALIAACQRLQTTIWWEAPVLGLALREGDEGDQVVGVVVRRAGRQVRVLAGRGVVLGQGGFGGDSALRRDLLPAGTRKQWSLIRPQFVGADLLRWAQELGLGVAALGDAWWRPALWNPMGGVWDARQALAWPHGLMVNAAGQRFCDESAPGDAVCQAILTEGRRLGPESVPCWLILDSQHRKQVALGKISPGRVPRPARDQGFITVARTIPELAWAIKVDAQALQGTVERFDGFAEAGCDDDFGRGGSAYSKALGDASHRPNPCLGGLTKPPFYAVRVVPADAGTKGGLVVDEQARVLREDDSVMPNLWAVSSAAASLAGGGDPAPGFGLAEAMVFGRIAAESLTRAAGLLAD